jgi:hypothetical protein
MPVRDTNRRFWQEITTDIVLWLPEVEFSLWWHIFCSCEVPISCSHYEHRSRPWARSYRRKARYT